MLFRRITCIIAEHSEPTTYYSQQIKHLYNPPCCAPTDVYYSTTITTLQASNQLCACNTSPFMVAAALNPRKRLSATIRNTAISAFLEYNK